MNVCSTVYLGVGIVTYSEFGTCVPTWCGDVKFSNSAIRKNEYTNVFWLGIF